MSSTTNGSFGSSRFNLLQQELITASARLDRQVQQLTRLNRLSNRLLAATDERRVSEVFAEAVVDVLDVSVGAAWVLPTSQPAGQPAPDLEPVGFSVCGAVEHPTYSDLGARIADEMDRRRLSTVARLHALGLDSWNSIELVDALAVRCVGRDGAVRAVLVAANTPIATGMGDAIGDDAAEMLMALAEKCAVAIDDRDSHRLMHQQLQQLRESEERFELVLRGTNDGWWDWDLRSGSCFYSARWLELTGAQPESEVPGHGVTRGFWATRVHPDDRHDFDVLLTRALAGELESVETELRLYCDDDSYLPVLVRGTISHDGHGMATHFAGSILDLTERKVHEERIHRLAFYDPLTELPNRRLLNERIAHALTAYGRTGQAAAVLMLDVDRFKTLNDTHGHAAGDELLRVVGERLAHAVRPYDTVARLSGDEFIVLLENLGSDPVEAELAAERIAGKVRSVLDAPCALRVGVVHYTASIGVALITDSNLVGDASLTVDTVLKHADVALYQAKEAGRNAVRLFHPVMQQRLASRSAMEARLRAAIEHNELTMHYQPIVDTHGVLVGAEALMRWLPLQGQPVAPSEFIPIAEESGLIHTLGRWCLETVCGQLVEWRSLLPDGFRVAVNLSAPEFLHPDFTDRVLGTLLQFGVPGSRLLLEITEATVVTDLAFAAERMNALRFHDVQFSLDDFGTGYSSLTYLRRLPVSEVKIDRSYVGRVLHDVHDAAIVKAILELCASLDLRVVAEGVETDAQWRRLIDDGCRFFQGFHFGAPVAPASHPAELLVSAGVAGAD